MRNEEEWVNYIREYAVEDGDPEIAHTEADKALCLFLRSLGHFKIVEEWEKVKKWYA